MAAAVFASQNSALAVLTTNHLVYNFSYSSSQNITARDSQDSAEPIGVANGGGYQISPGGNGISHYGGSLTDKGTITVDIVSKQVDGGVVVKVSEQGQNVRRAPAATCVVYGNTRVICDPNKTVYTEEYTLLRFMGSNFIDPNQLDASKHWAITQNGDNLSVSADYTIDNNTGGIMRIGEKRIVKQMGVGHLTTDIETQIGYDFSRSIPTSVDEYATQYTDAGIKGTSRTTYQTTLNLASAATPTT